MIREVDADGNGKIDFNEFRTMMTSQKKDTDLETDIWNAFKEFDEVANSFKFSINLNCTE